jgi:uncharacterized repeat protein (TIGR04076 family)
MAHNPGYGRRLMAEVTGLKGTCSAGHKVGDRFEVSCHDAAGMCGFLYTALFPTLNVMQFDGSFPWGTDETVFNCPDLHNLLTVKVWRVPLPEK